MGSETERCVGQAECLALETISLPDKTSYSRGDRITYEGAAFAASGIDVTEYVSYSPAQGSDWPKKSRKVQVEVAYIDETGLLWTSKFDLRRKRNPVPLLFAVALALAFAGGALAWPKVQPRGDIGSYVMPQGEMSEDEIREMLDRQTEQSRIAVSLASPMLLGGDGRLRVNFTVAEPNNGFSERFELNQDGRLIYSSGVVEPGYAIEWAYAPDVRVGDITATVYAVGSDGGDFGNPVSVEVDVVGDETP